MEDYSQRELLEIFGKPLLNPLLQKLPRPVKFLGKVGKGLAKGAYSLAKATAPDVIEPLEQLGGSLVKNPLQQFKQGYSGTLPFRSEIEKRLKEMGYVMEPKDNPDSFRLTKDGNYLVQAKPIGSVNPNTGKYEADPRFTSAFTFKADSKNPEKIVMIPNQGERRTPIKPPATPAAVPPAAPTTPTASSTIPQVNIPRVPPLPKRRATSKPTPTPTPAPARPTPPTRRPKPKTPVKPKP